MDFDTAESKWKRFRNNRFSIKTRLICTAIIAPLIVVFLFLIYRFSDDTKVIMIVIFMSVCFHVLYFIWFKGAQWEYAKLKDWEYNPFITMERQKWDSIKEEREKYYEEQRKNTQENEGKKGSSRR